MTQNSNAALAVASAGTYLARGLEQVGASLEAWEINCFNPSVLFPVRVQVHRGSSLSDINWYVRNENPESEATNSTFSSYSHISVLWF